MKTVTLIDMEYDRDIIPEDVFKSLGTIAKGNSDLYFYVFCPGEFQTDKYYDNHHNVINWLNQRGLDCDRVLFKYAKED